MMPRTFVITVWSLWSVVLVLIVTGSVIVPLQQHAPWESSGLSHFLAYMAAGVLPMLLSPEWRRVVALFGGLVVLGAVLELIQVYLPYRHGLLMDAVINAGGAAAGIGAGRVAAGVLVPRVIARWPRGGPD